MSEFHKKMLALCALISLSSASYAELVREDFINTGDNLVVVDVDSGVRWMSFDNLRGLSINDAKALMVEGAIYEGWEVASYEVVHEFASRHFGQEYTALTPNAAPGVFNEDSTGYSESTTPASVMEYFNVFGSALVNGRDYTYGLYENGIEGDDRHFLMGVSDSYGTFTFFFDHYAVRYGDGTYRSDWVNNIYAPLLVETASVEQYFGVAGVSNVSFSGSALVGLLGIGAFGLIRRKK